MTAPFEEVVQALGRVGECDVGIQTIRVASIVGSADRNTDFDGRFRPTSSRARPRFERIAAAQRRGAPMPPIDVYRVGAMHFVRDGHHSVAVACAQGRTATDAHVVEVITRVAADAPITVSELPRKRHERDFHERVPLAAAYRSRISLSDPTRYAALAERVEAWGARLIDHERRFIDRAEVARRWFEDEYEPVVELLRDYKRVGRRERETDAYLQLTRP
ncbi:MAG: chromosome partitioning protein ParB [Solirubrobacteraceae bacterium]